MNGKLIVILFYILFYTSNSIRFISVLLTFLGRFLPCLIAEECDGRTDGRTEKHGSFYCIDLLSIIFRSIYFNQPQISI